MTQIVSIRSRGTVASAAFNLSGRMQSTHPDILFRKFAHMIWAASRVQVRELDGRYVTVTPQWMLAQFRETDHKFFALKIVKGFVKHHQGPGVATFTRRQIDALQKPKW